MTRHRVVLVLSGLFALAACTGSFFGGPDRPDDPDLAGSTPPPAFGCSRGKVHLKDNDGDGKNESVEHVDESGSAICRGEDTNGDGKLDRWSSLSNGKTVDQVSDVDYDGDFDKHRRDSDGDGKLDYEGAYLPANLSLPPNWAVDQQKNTPTTQ